MTPGQIAYEAYCEHTGWKSLATGAALPKWYDVKPEIKATWEAAAVRLMEQLCDCTGEVKSVVGFMFSHDQTRVVMVRKKNPEWQRGKLNGPGGKVELDETALDAMVREFSQEVRTAHNLPYVTTPQQWRHYLRLRGGTANGPGEAGDKFQVDFFVTVGDVLGLNDGDETVEVTLVADVRPSRPDMIENCPWAILLAMDVLEDDRPGFVICQYP